jgi:hypothetical protein
MERVRLHITDAEELFSLYFALVDLTHRYNIYEARRTRISDKREEMKTEALSREASSA